MADSLTARIYEKLPWWLQNVACSIKAISLKRERFGGEYREATRFLEESQWWPLSRLAEYQNGRLREIVRHAYETVPFYREVFDQRGLGPDDIQTVEDLPKLPVLDKETVRARFRDMLSVKWPKRRITYGHTSGTTGTALHLAYDKATIQWQWAIWQRHRRRFGIELGDERICFGARGAVPLGQMRPPFWRRVLPMRRTYVSMHHMTSQNMPALVDYLQKRRVKVYEGYPSGLYILASYLLENGIALRHPPQYVVSGTETLLPHQRKALEMAFRAEVTDQYGVSEYCGNISECERHQYHVDMELGIVEFLPDPMLPEGQRRIVLTGLHNPVMPLIRYSIDDIATLAKGACDCGRESPTVERIDGRIESYIITPDGRQLGRLDVLFKDADSIREVQLLQNEVESVTVKVVPRPEYAKSDEEQLLRRLRQYLGEVIRIDLVHVDAIPREPNGKFRQIVSTAFRDRIRPGLERADQR